MFPSSQNNIYKLSEDSSPASVVEEINMKKVWNKINREKQMSPTKTSSSEKTGTPDKTSEKSSQARFDRNNQNISKFYHKCSPSNSSQTSQTESQMFSVMSKCPSKLFIATSDVRGADCPQLTSSSSSTSLTSEHFPVKLKTNNMHWPKIKHHFSKHNHPNSRSQRRQTNPFEKIDTSYQEQFYSCNSEDSENDEKPEKLQTSQLSNKNLDILELLQQVVHLINKTSPVGEDAMRPTQVTPFSADDKSSKMTGQQLEEKEIMFKDKTTSISQLAPIIYYPHPCCCSCCFTSEKSSAHLAPPTFPFIQPYNLKAAFAEDLTTLEPFAYEATDSFKDCSSGNRSTSTDAATPFRSSSNIIDGKLKNLSNIFTSLYPGKKQSNELDLPLKTDTTIPLADQVLKDKVLEMEQEYVDEELHPCCVDTILTEPLGFYGPSPDSLMEYDDEEPMMSDYIEYVDEEIHPVFVEVKQMDRSVMCEPCQDCLREHDDEEPTYPDITKAISEFEGVLNRESKSLEELVKENEFEKIKTLDESLSEKSFQVEREEITEMPSLIEPTITENVNKVIDETLPLTEQEESPYRVYTSPTTGQNIYNFLPEIDKPDKPRQQLITYSESEEEYDSYHDKDYELVKEKLSEIRKRKTPKYVDQAPGNDTTVATLKQLEGESSPAEMKFFIDSLILDLEAMDYARRKSQFEKNICKTKIGLCDRDSFPVTITDVTDLGASSLYVKWKIHDCFGIDGYEIYTDGYLTNRYYNSRHDSAVITHVDVTLPHKIALVAQPCGNDESLEFICNRTSGKNKPKSLTCKTVAEKQRALQSNLWTPSIFLYDPVACRTNLAPPSIRDNF